MADDLGGAIPGTDTKSLIRQIMTQADTANADVTKATGELESSRDREATARAAQVAAQAPTRARLKEKIAASPEAPEFSATPEAPKQAPMDPKQFGETLSLITALAAMGGALTRQPLTAALNNFSAGVHGYVQGNQQVFQDNLKQFDANLKKSNTENETQWRKYQAARDKHGADIQGLTLELQQIAAETQNPIDMELAKQGRIVDLMKLAETRNKNYSTALTQVARMQEAAQTHQDSAAATAAYRSATLANTDRRLDQADRRESRLTGNAKIAQEKNLRTEHDKLAKPISEYDRDIAKVRTAILTNSPLGDIEARQLLTSLSKGARGTNMQMKITQNFGDLGTRLGGFFTNVLSGRATDEQRKQVLGFLDALDQTVVQPEKAALRDRYKFLAEQAGVDAANVINFGGTSDNQPVEAGKPFDPNAFLDQFSKNKPPGG